MNGRSVFALVASGVLGIAACGQDSTSDVDLGPSQADGGTNAGMTGSGNGSDGKNGPGGSKGDGGSTVCHPTPEICGDHIDNNCNGQVDENCGEDDAGARGTTLEGEAGTRGNTFDGDAANDGRGSVTSGEGGSVLTLGSDCTVPAPRLVFPLSTSRVTSQTPLLKWELAAGTDGARIQICDSRDCSNVIQGWDVQGSQTTVPSALPRSVRYWRVAGKNGDSVGCTASPVWEFFVNDRSTSGPNTAWGTVLDVNEDGYADLLASATGNTGRTNMLYLGGPSGLSSTPSTTFDGDASYSAGDVNGDGFADVVTSHVVDSTNSEFRVYLGGAGGLATTYQVIATGSSWGSYGGQVVAAAGDVNGDGYADVLVQTTTADVVYPGSATGVSSTALSSVNGGILGNVANAGDVNGDGFGDVVTGGGPGGGATVYLGGTAGLGSPIAINPPGDSIDFGVPLTGGGDTDGDGYAEVLAVQCPNYAFGNGTAPPPTPTVWVFRGGPSGTASSPAVGLVPPGYGANTTGKFVLQVTALDANGDGFWDVAVADPQNDKAWVFMGSASGVATTPAVTLDNGADQGRFGQGLSGADADRDGFEDLVIGAASAPQTGSGRAYVFNGSTSGTQTTPSITLSANNILGSFGFSLSLSASGS
jgi:hypothetical protein